jgi:hypothetical protein
VLSDTVIRTDPVTGATSHLLELSLTQRRKVLSLERVLKLASYDDKPLFLRNEKSGKVAHWRVRAPSHMDEEGNYHPPPRTRPAPCAANTFTPNASQRSRGKPRRRQNS